ncbi:MAG: sodium/solute symporter [Prevotellaceae bacterium]|jgi:SSS family solute:Na+ symporter|nr:sodium/solute symporter [Prevotellaceae bacterium]
MKHTIVNLTGLDIAVLVAFVVVLFGVAYWASFVKKRKPGESLFLAGKTLGWFSIGLTMWGTNVGPSMLLANASSGFEGGLAAGNFSWYAFPFICLLALVFAPRYLGFGISTLPEFMGKRFGGATQRYIACYSIVTIVVSWLGLTLFSGGVFMEQVLGIPMWACVVILVSVSAAFTMAGGLRAVAYTNVYQMIILIAVSGLLTGMAISKLGGVGAVVAQTPPSYWNLLRPLGDADFPWLAVVLGYPVMGVWFWCTDQSMVQSVLGARNLKQGQLGASFAAWLKLLDIPLFILPGILCFLLLPKLANSTDAYLSLVSAVFPSGLVGMVVTVMMFALVGTIASALNSLSAVFTMDIYLKRRRLPATPAQLNRIGRMVTLGGAVLSIFLALAITRIQGLSFFNIFQSVLGFIAPPMSAAFLFSVFWQRTTTRSVNLVLTAGTALSLGTGLLYYTGVVLAGVHFLLISFGLFVALCAAIVAISLAAPAPAKAAVESAGAGKPLRRAILIPWALLAAIMVALYVIFNGH